MVVPVHAVSMPSTIVTVPSDKASDEGAAEAGQRVFDTRRDLVEVFAGDDAVRYHLFQFLNQHFFADANDQAAELAETARMLSEIPQDQRLPFAAHDGKGGFESTAIYFPGHTYFLVGTCIPSSAYLL